MTNNFVYPFYMMYLKRFFLIFCLPCLTIHAGDAIQNGDFTNGRGGWDGQGKVITVDEAGQPVATGGFPALELQASKNSNTACEQTLRIDRDVSKIRITVIAKAASDYKVNEKAGVSALSFGFYSGPSTSAFETQNSTVKPNFAIQVYSPSDRSRHSQTQFLEPGGEWKTITTNLTLNAANRQKNMKLAMMLAPGEGIVLVRSVNVETVK